MIFAAVDVETTGLNTKNDEIIEIAVILFDNLGTVIEQYHSYCSTYHPIPSDATSINGITNSMVKDYESYIDQRPKIMLMLKKANKFVGHNAMEFDIPMMGLEADESRVCDTLIMCRNKFPNREHNLRNMCRAHKIHWSDSQAHGALYDAQKAMELFLALEFGTNLQVDMFDNETPVDNQPKKSFWNSLKDRVNSTKKISPVEVQIIQPIVSTETKLISSDINMPRIENGNLIVPFLAPDKYHWWGAGQNAMITLKELGASEEMMEKYRGINTLTPNIKVA